MATMATTHEGVAEAAEIAARGLVSVERNGDASFIHLPLIYPSGSFVTVKIDQVANALRVSDNGFAFRELESFGAQRSFTKAASAIADAESLTIGRRTIFAHVRLEELSRAICDVAVASWQVADKIVGQMADEDVDEIEDHLRIRLTAVFGEHSVAIGDKAAKVIGASSSEWDVSAVVRLAERPVIFHAVSNYPNSVFKASTAFHDLAALERPPGLVAVVRDKSALGPRLNLLSQAGRVIEEGQSDDVYRRAAA